jgi:hypothetical protein
MPGVITGRCNPYGNATDRGPARLLGGIYGPEYEGRYKWGCTSPADGRFVFVCANGHRGQPQSLCYAHVAEITKRMSSLCPPCAYPAEARELTEAIERDQRELGWLTDRGLFDSRQGAMLRAKIEAAGYRMTELRVSGRTPNVAGRWEEIS